MTQLQTLSVLLLCALGLLPARLNAESEKMVDKIAEGKLNKFFKESCLMNQVYVRDPNMTIQDYLNDVIAKTGEKINIRRFARFQVGD